MQNAIEPAFDKLVMNKVAAGLYGNADEVLRDALRQMQERDAGSEWVRNVAVAGFDQLDRGEFVELTREELMTHLRKQRPA